MPATFTISSGSDRVVNVYPKRHRSSRSSASVQSPETSSASRSYSSASSESWSRGDSPYEEDGIVPSDSASRPRRSSRRYETEVQPAPPRRRSSHRSAAVERDDPPRRRYTTSRHTSSHSRHAESRRSPSDDSASVASYDDYPYSHHGAPQPPPPQRGYPPHAGYRNMPAPQSHGGYPPSAASVAPYHDPFAAQALVHMPPPDPFYPPQPNPFAPQLPRDNPFSPNPPMSSAADSGYFPGDLHAPPVTHPHHRNPVPTRPQSYVAPSPQYAGSEMSMYSGHGPYPGYPPMHGVPPGYIPPWAYVRHESPPIEKEKESKEKLELDSLKALIEKHEAARIAAETARIAEEKERLAKAEADAAAAAAKKAEEEAEKRRKEEVAAALQKTKEEAEKKAQEDAKKAEEEHEKKMAEAKKAHDELEKKAIEEHEKKMAEAKKAHDDLEKKHKELEAEAEKNKPTPDSLKPPLKFKDALGRKFSFPWHICKTWKGMEGLIKQAFLHVEDYGYHVEQGHYDLVGPDGEIILPQVWDTMIQPDWEVIMMMWPMPEPEKPDKLQKDAQEMFMGFENLAMPPVEKKRKDGKKKDGKKAKKSPEIVNVGAPLGPPPGFPGGIGFVDGDFLMDTIVNVPEKKPTKPKKTVRPTALQQWIVGGGIRRKS
ncbi:Hypothetical protein R9X50_00657900 [Acrodontium crateriforme]|uniref:Ubiquitin-like domain-containing protein n=1 Tax=Acrodontium crateriforme TaxID=150365 RepID=A0AAQ3R6W7_9PEZI|nr:Hypothetical protein R9X50_00657900 [Acrodontium crateriforme]